MSTTVRLDVAGPLASRPARHNHRASLAWSHVLVTFTRNYPLGAMSAAMLILMVVLASLALVIAPYDPVLQNISLRLPPPSALNLLGTDNFGRDVLSRLLFGSRISMFVAMASVLPATLIGLALGVASAYFKAR